MSRPPEPELARLYRYREDLPPDTLTQWVPEENLLIINTNLWFDLESHEQRAIMRTPRSITVKTHIVTDEMDQAA